LSFVALIRQILRMHSEAMTPRQIREIIKVDYPGFYGTESHLRNVEKGYYKSVDHAVDAQIYSASRTATGIIVDKTQKPLRLTLPFGKGNDVKAACEKTNIVKPEKLRARVVAHKVIMRRTLSPCPDLIAEYLSKWQQLENYRLQEDSLGLLFHNLCPENKKIEHVLLKVSALNEFLQHEYFRYILGSQAHPHERY